MSKSINKVTLVGNIGRVEKFDANGTPVVRMSIATSEDGYTKQDGTQVPEKTQWHNVVAYRKLAEIILQHIGEGEAKSLNVSRIYVEGKLDYRMVEKDGQKRTYTDIVLTEMVMLDKRQPQGQQYAPQGNIPQNQPQWGGQQQYYPQGQPQYGQPQFPQYPPQGCNAPY